MEQALNKVNKVTNPGGNPNWRKGVSANPSGRPAGKAKRMALVEEWTRDFGGVEAFNAVQRLLLDQAAAVALGPHPKREEDRIRRANTLSRLMAQAGIAALAHTRNERPNKRPSHPFAPPSVDAGFRDQIERALSDLRGEGGNGG